MKKFISRKGTARDGACRSLWQNIAGAAINAPIPVPVMLCDCLIVGGGITGLTTALRLQNSGKKTIIADGHTVGFGTTGGTSAHINTFADTTYAEAESAFGKTGANLFAEAIAVGFQEIKNNIGKYHIDCDYEDKTGYLYAENEDEVKQLADIYEGALKVSVPVNYTTEVPTPVPYLKALSFAGQAQFHPIKYLHGLQKAYIAAGGVILENTLIEGIETENGIHNAVSKGQSIRAKTVVYATHMPPNINFLNFKCAPYRSYVMAVKLKSGKYPDALIYDSQEPYHYVRTHMVDGEKVLIAGGSDHKTGHDEPEKAFAELERYIRKYYNVSSIKYKWSSQYYVPVDGLPYIGQMPLTSAGIYCATGYNGNGMMLGSVAGIILSDLINGMESRYEKLFSPGRVKPIDGFSEFVKENTDVMYHLVADRFGLHETDSLHKLANGMGKLVEIDGKKIGAYRDDNGVIHAINPVCTHAACIVNWNNFEKTWDCPCHGARYDTDGKVLTGPATKPLVKINSNQGSS